MIFPISRRNSRLRNIRLSKVRTRPHLTTNIYVDSRLGNPFNTIMGSNWLVVLFVFVNALYYAEPAHGQPGKQERDRLSDLATWGWKSMGDLKVSREMPRLIELEQGKVLLIGGGSEPLSTATDTTDVFEESTHEWTVGPKLNHRHRDAEVVKLQEGAILVIGGSEGPTKTGSPWVEKLAPGSQKWEYMAPLNEPRISHAAVVLNDGRVLVTGGQSDPENYLATCELYDPAANKWEMVGQMSEVRATHHLRLMKDGTPLVIGGGTDTSATRRVEKFDIQEKVWKPVAPMFEPRWGFASAVLDDGRIVVAGGRILAQKGAAFAEDQMVILRSVEVYDPDANQWNALPPMNIPRSIGIPNVALIKLPDGRLLFNGGESYPAPYQGINSVEYFDPSTTTWSMAAPMRIGRSYHASILLACGEILTAGGRGLKFLPLSKTECFGPVLEK
jgi:N-acetylneuraminic acid mutarotase